MGKIIKIRDYGGLKNRSERIITKWVSCDYEIRQVLILQIVATFIANYGSKFIAKWKAFLQNGPSITNGVTLLQHTTGFSIRDIYYKGVF